MGFARRGSKQLSIRKLFHSWHTVVGCEVLALPDLLEHEELGDYSDSFKVDGEGPQPLQKVQNISLKQQTAVNQITGRYSPRKDRCGFG